MSGEQEHYPRYGCAFCLYANYHWYFETKLKSGKPSRMLECPNCHLRFRESSLIKEVEFTPDFYAKWIVQYPFQDFWHRIKFDYWKKQITVIFGSANMGYFWDRYHYWKNERAVVERPVMTDEEIQAHYEKYSKSFDQ